MTTVINFNILNFFRLQLNRVAVSSVRYDTRVSYGGREAPPEREHVIDVTPGRIAPHESGSGNAQAVWPYRGERATGRPTSEDRVAYRTYDRMGKTVDFSELKGMHVDAYI